MKKPKRAKHYKNKLDQELDEGLDWLSESKHEDWFEETFREPWDHDRVTRWLRSPNFAERYPHNSLAPDSSFILTENAKLRALYDLGVPLVARWSSYDRISYRHGDGYLLSGHCTKCNAPIYYFLYEWEKPMIRLEDYLSEALQCEHVPQVELDGDQFDIMLALELLADPS